MDKKTIIIICFIAGISIGLFFLGRSSVNRSAVGTDTELYQNTLTEIGNLRSEIEEYSKLIGKLEPELTELTTAITNSQNGVEASIGISSDIESCSGEIGDIAGKLNRDIADIGEASRGLAEIFDVNTEEP
ncbi:MAG: hypothetical protein PQJ46_09495 [Spirochaetales bacterium]|nr:hypothetical protein [Spirochaetales bacterium]